MLEETLFGAVVSECKRSAVTVTDTLFVGKSRDDKKQMNSQKSRTMNLVTNPATSQKKQDKD